MSKLNKASLFPACDDGGGRLVGGIKEPSWSICVFLTFLVDTRAQAEAVTSFLCAAGVFFVVAGIFIILLNITEHNMV